MREEGSMPAAPVFTFPNSLGDLRVAAGVALDDWNDQRLLDPQIRNLVAQQYWRASLSKRLAAGDHIGATFVVFAACIGNDIGALGLICEEYLAGEPVGLKVTPEDGQRIILDMYSVIRADGELSKQLDDYTDSLMGDICAGLGCTVAMRIGVHDAKDPIGASIARHVHVMAALLTVAGTA